MRNFCRVLKVAFRNQFTLVGIGTCSCLIALLWGANIGMIYPVVEIISHGESTHQLMDKQISEAQNLVTDLREELDKQLLEPATNGERITFLQTKLAAEEGALATRKSLQPYVHAYLPDDPFQMLVLVIVLMLICAAAKNAALLVNAILVAR